MCHLRRTHGVCLRWLSACFREAHYKLYYERSALQAADIYTKAFIILAELDRACELVNHLDPKRFWSGCNAGHAKEDKDLMSSEHKGGVVFDYWVSNLWHGRDSLKKPKANAAPDSPMAVAAATPTKVGHAADFDD